MLKKSLTGINYQNRTLTVIFLFIFSKQNESVDMVYRQPQLMWAIIRCTHGPRPNLSVVSVAENWTSVCYLILNFPNPNLFPKPIKIPKKKNLKIKKLVSQAMVDNTNRENKRKVLSLAFFLHQLSFQPFYH